VVVASIVDITQRYVQEAAPERSRALLEQTRKIAGGGGWELDPRYRAGIWSVVTAMKSESGDLIGCLGIARDVTHENEVQTKIREATSMAERANLAKSGFLASMSHEIRTPMNGVIGFADLLLDGDLTPQQRNHTTRLQDAAKSLLSLMNDIIDLSQIEAGKLEIETIPMSPDAVVHSAVSIVRTQLAAKGLDLRIERTRDFIAVQ
jgi:signal transduction histidine kinase